MNDILIKFTDEEQKVQVKFSCNLLIDGQKKKEKKRKKKKNIWPCTRVESENLWKMKRERNKSPSCYYYCSLQYNK